MSDFSVQELVGDNSFRAWAEGRADTGEKTYWDRWVQKSAKNRRLARQAQARITGFSFRPLVKPHTERAWKKLEQRIAGQIRFRQLSAPRRRQPLWIYGAAASILVIIAIGLSELIYTPAEKVSANAVQQKVHTAYGQRRKVMFPGGASIILNAHSTLTYAANQSKGQGISVTLHGEAYFSTAGRTQPGNTVFTVRTPDGKITDIGT
jgi:ferric-dicitrate binding protein FerR (iron transport regulator)